MVHSCEGGGKGDGASLGNRLRLSIQSGIVHVPVRPAPPLVPDMRKAVNAALHTKYESGKWKKWFVETAKRVSKEVDEDSNVRACSCVCVCVCVCVRFYRLPFFISGV